MRKKQCPELHEQIIILAIVNASLRDGLQIGLIEEGWHGCAARRGNVFKEQHVLLWKAQCFRVFTAQ